MHILIGNFSDYTLALLAFAQQKQLKNLYVISIDTGWGADAWQARVDLIERWVKAQHFEWVRLKPENDFTALIRERREFPSVRFQWCASLLKGLPILNWLDKHDPKAEATLLLPKTPLIDQACKTEWIESYEPMGDRRLWFPLYPFSEKEINALAISTGMGLWQHPSLECAPCIHHQAKTRALYLKQNCPHFPLETALKQTFPTGDAVTESSLFAAYQRGCGNLFGCGL